MRNAQCAEPSRHPSGATLPFKEGKAKVCTFGAIITQSRVKLVETERSSPPRKEAEKFFGDSAPLKGELAKSQILTEGFSRKECPCGEQKQCAIAGEKTKTERLYSAPSGWNRNTL